MRQALAARDISRVYRFLVAAGISGRAIGRATGQTQSEVSEILHGRRVMGYDLLVRIADGFGIERGWMGLAYSGPGAADAAGTSDPALEDDEVIRRRFLGASAGALLGAVVVGEPGGLPLLTGPLTGALGKHDVGWITDLTARLRDLALLHGGGSVYAAARGSAVNVMGGLRATTEPSRDLLLAASGVCRVAGFSAFDAGDRPACWQAYATALDLAREAAHPPAVVSIVESAGRAEIHSGNHRQAAKLFELMSVRREFDAVAWGLLASAYAPNSPDAARGALRHMRDAAGADTPDAASMTGHVSADLGDYETAVAAHTAVLPHRTGTLAVDEVAPLAVAHLRAGEVRLGAQHAATALDLAESVRSAGCTDTIERLGADLAAQSDSTCQDLSRRALAHA